MRGAEAEEVEAVANGHRQEGVQAASDPTQPVPPAPTRAPIDALRERYAEQRSEPYTDIAIPGFGGELVVRYRALPWEKDRKIAERAVRASQQDTRREINLWADELIGACEQFMVREGGKLVPAHPEQPLRYDQRLAEGLGLERPGGEPFTAARQVLFAVFTKGAGGDSDRADYLVAAHHDEYLAWLRGLGGLGGAADEADAAFAGE